jgi:hypothetical protein
LIFSSFVLRALVNQSKIFSFWSNGWVFVD